MGAHENPLVQIRAHRATEEVDDGRSKPPERRVVAREELREDILEPIPEPATGPVAEATHAPPRKERALRRSNGARSQGNHLFE